MLVKPRTDLHAPLSDGRTLPSVDMEKLYIVASMTPEDFQIVDDEGEPIFVPRSRFDILDDWIPNDWVREAGEEGWYWYGPSQCVARGFFERWHDGSMPEREVFAEVYMRLWKHHEKQLINQKLVLVRIG